VAKGARVRVVDNFSSGRLAYLAPHITAHQVELLQADLLEPGVAEKSVSGVRTVFHLAADHGGRGYVDLHQSACATNLTLDGMLFRPCRSVGVKKLLYSSSGCVYTNFRQNSPDEVLYLSEDMVGPPYDADNMYGWAKLMGEMSLQAFVREGGMKGASCRYFTVYGERGKEDHAVIAMIARAFVKENPFEVWGSGNQIRNWTHVSDIVDGTMLAAERIDDGSALNLGTMERTRVIDAAREVLRYTGYEADIRLRPDMPTGPLNRVADNTLARRLLGWQPKVRFIEGLHRTIDWYFASKTRTEVKDRLAVALTER